MRICGGEFRGRKLASFTGSTLRPTPEHIRESIFNIIGQDLKGVRVLDLFAGTGVLGLEAVSRGADITVMVDKSPQALAVIKKNIESLQVRDRALALRHDLTRGLNPVFNVLPECDLVFLDPPYGKNLSRPILRKLDKGKGILPGGLIIVEHFKKEELAVEPLGSLQLIEKRTYGQTTISIVRKS